MIWWKKGRNQYGNTSLFLRLIDMLQKSLFSQHSVKAVVSIPLWTNEATKSECTELSGVESIGIHMTNVNLYRSMVFRRDETVCRRATRRQYGIIPASKPLSGFVQVDFFTFFALHSAQTLHRPHKQKKESEKKTKCKGPIFFFVWKLYCIKWWESYKCNLRLNSYCDKSERIKWMRN